jgi:hypothetical protein
MQCTCAILSSVAYLALQNFSTLSHKRHNFRKRVIEYKMCVWFSLQLVSKAFLILRRTERDVIKNVYLSSSKVPDILVKLQWNLNYLNRFLNNYWNVEFHENTPSGSWVVLCGQTDMTNLIVAFGNFVNKLKNTVPQWAFKLNNAPQTWLLNGYKLEVLQVFQIHVWICCIIVYFLIGCVNLYQELTQGNTIKLWTGAGKDFNPIWTPAKTTMENQ